MKYLIHKSQLISLTLLLLSIFSAYFATKYAYIGLYHYGPFLLGPFVLYDGTKTYYENNQKLTLPIFVELLFGAFFISEHLYLVQIFWAGSINF